MYLIYTVYNNFKFILLTSIALHSLSVRNACLILSLLHMKYLSILFYLNVLHLFGLEFFEHLYSQLLHVQYVCHSPVGGGGGGISAATANFSCQKVGWELRITMKITPKCMFCFALMPLYYAYVLRTS
jgi:hypothetical protein